MLYVFHRILLYEHNLYSTDVETGGWVSRGFGSFKKYVTARGWMGGGGVLVFFVINRYENFGGWGRSHLYSGT